MAACVACCCYSVVPESASRTTAEKGPKGRRMRLHVYPHLRQLPLGARARPWSAKGSVWQVHFLLQEDDPLRPCPAAESDGGRRRATSPNARLWEPPREAPHSHKAFWSSSAPVGSFVGGLGGLLPDANATGTSHSAKAHVTTASFSARAGCCATPSRATRHATPRTRSPCPP